MIPGAAAGRQSIAAVNRIAGRSLIDRRNRLLAIADAKEWMINAVSAYCNSVCEGRPAATAMKITAIRTVVVNARMRNWIFVRVETDVPGLHGWGEATL